MQRTLSAATPIVALVLTSSHTFAGLVSTFNVGTGVNSSTIEIDYSNSEYSVITLNWDTPLNGFSALQTALTSIAGSTLNYDTFSFGVFVTGIGIGSNYESGDGDQWPVENYWHYWTFENGAWELAQFGASDRTITNGSADAWVFGSSVAPQGVPTPGALVAALGLSFTNRMRRRTRTH